MFLLNGKQRPQYSSVKAYLSVLAKDIAELVVDSEKNKRFQEQLRIYNKLWETWTIADEADRNGCWTPSMGRPEYPLNVFSRTYNLWYDSEKEIKRLPGFYSLLAFIHDRQLPNLNKLNNGIVLSEIAEKTLSAPSSMLEHTSDMDLSEMYVIEEFYNHVKIDLKENFEKGGDKSKPEKLTKKEQNQKVKTLTDIELFECLAKKFEKRAIKVLEPEESWQSLDRSLKEYFVLAIQRLQQAGKSNEVGLLKYRYKNLLHFARGINFKSFRGFPDTSIVASARKYAVELTEMFKDLAQIAKENVALKKPVKDKKKLCSRKEYEEFLSIHHDFSLLIDPPSEITDSEFSFNKTNLCYKIEVFFDRFVQICDTLGISLLLTGKPELIDPSMANYVRAWAGQTNLLKSEPHSSKKLHVNLDVIKKTISSLTKSGQPKAIPHKSYPSNLAKAPIDKMLQAQLIWRRDKIKQIFDNILVRLQELFETKDKKKTNARVSTKTEEVDKFTKREKEGMIEPKPPEILQKILWIKKHGRKHWKLLSVAVVVLLLGVLASSKFYLFRMKNKEIPSKAISDDSNANMKDKVRELEEQVKKANEMAAPPTLTLLKENINIVKTNDGYTVVLVFKPSKIRPPLGPTIFEAKVEYISKAKIIDFHETGSEHYRILSRKISDNGKEARFTYDPGYFEYPKVELKTSDKCRVRVSGSHIPESFFIDIE